MRFTTFATAAIVGVTMTCTMAQPNVASAFREITCCEGGFTVQKATRSAQSVASQLTGQIRFVLIQGGDPPRAMGSVSPGPIRGSYRFSQMVDAFRSSMPTALYVESAAGVALDIWWGSTGAFERRVLRGKNPFMLDDSLEVIWVDEFRYQNARKGLSRAVRVWARSTRGLSISECPAILKVVSGVFAAQELVVRWSNSGWLPDEPGIPFVFLPRMGLEGLPDDADAWRNGACTCVWPDAEPGGGTKCTLPGRIK